MLLLGKTSFCDRKNNFLMVCEREVTRPIPQRMALRLLFTATLLLNLLTFRQAHSVSHRNECNVITLQALDLKFS